MSIPSNCFPIHVLPYPTVKIVLSTSYGCFKHCSLGYYFFCFVAVSPLFRGCFFSNFINHCLFAGQCPTFQLCFLGRNVSLCVKKISARAHHHHFFVITLGLYDRLSFFVNADFRFFGNLCETFRTHAIFMRFSCAFRVFSCSFPVIHTSARRIISALFKSYFVFWACSFMQLLDGISFLDFCS